MAVLTKVRRAQMLLNAAKVGKEAPAQQTGAVPQSTIGKPLTGGTRRSRTKTLSGKIGRKFKLGRLAEKVDQVKAAEQNKINEQTLLTGVQTQDVAGTSIGGTEQDPALLAAQEEMKKKKALMAQRAAANTPRTVLG